MRCLGRGITPTMVYGRKCGILNTSAETVAAIHAEFDEKFELQKQETETRIQAEREACRIEIELKMEAFKQELLSQLQCECSVLNIVSRDFHGYIDIPYSTCI